MVGRANAKFLELYSSDHSFTLLSYKNQECFTFRGLNLAVIVGCHFRRVAVCFVVAFWGHRLRGWSTFLRCFFDLYF